MNPRLILTAAASAYIKKRILEHQGKGFRLSIKKTGCSGYSYVPTIVTTIDATDIQIEQEGMTFFLDTAWLSMLDGVVIDYVEEEKSGLKQKRLMVTHPSESGRCGCGESFHFEPQASR
jgi:iron-sulfur cluster assembly protein